MNSSASASRSAVVVPAFAWSRSSASVRATTDPAAAMRSISRGDLRMIIGAAGDGVAAMAASRSASTAFCGRAPSISTTRLPAFER